MQSFGDQTPTSATLEDIEPKAPAPDDPSVVEAEEAPEPVGVPEGVSEVDYLEQNLPA